MGGGISPLEALRAVMTALGIVAGGIGVWRSPDGRLAFPRPIRARMVRRRRKQMFTYIRIFTSIGIATANAATVVTPWPPSFPILLTNIVFIYIMVELLFLMWDQTSGWVEFERIVHGQPIVPVQQSAEQLSRDARPIVHDINGVTAAIIAELDLAANSGNPWKANEAIPGVIAKLYELDEMHKQIQTLVRHPTVQSGEEISDTDGGT